ncbi:MAG: metallophosphoesterase [Lachnospiraceae bacterium]|nr:metallophosphoesterase [Lachnospiraceae bacterium]
MKIIHCADLHLDSRMETHFTSEQAKIRRMEMLATFEDMVDYGLEHQVELILIAGDLFDSNQENSSLIKKQVLELIRHTNEIDFLYLAGNHDGDGFVLDTEEIPENLKLFSSKEWMTYSYGSIRISGVSQPQSRLQNPIWQEEHFNIVMLHGQIKEYGSDLLSDDILLQDYAGQSVDYMALGHIHAFSSGQLDERGIYCYPGCLEGRGFDECGEKGFVLLEIQGSELEMNFMPFSRRVFHRVEVLVNQGTVEETYYKVMEAVKSFPATDMIHLTFAGEKRMDTEWDVSYIRQRLIERFFLVKVEDKTRGILLTNNLEEDLSVKGEYVRIVNQLELSEKERDEVIQMGLLALQGRQVWS